MRDKDSAVLAHNFPFVLECLADVHITVAVSKLDTLHPSMLFTKFSGDCLQRYQFYDNKTAKV